MAKKLSDLFSNVDEVLNNAKIANFEEVFSRTKSFTEEVSKKSAERIELSRKKIEYLDTKAKLCKAYEKFGRLQYELYTGNQVTEADVVTIAGEVGDLNDKLTALTDELEAAKSPVTVNAEAVVDLKDVEEKKDNINENK